MASQILSGSSNPSYTNNTGQNVRLVINHLSGIKSISWAGNTISDLEKTVLTWVSGVTSIVGSIGSFDRAPSSGGLIINSSTVLTSNFRSQSGGVCTTDSLYFSGSGGEGKTYFLSYFNSGGSAGYTRSIKTLYVPSRIFLAPSETFSAVSGHYNIVVIKEDGT